MRAKEKLLSVVPPQNHTPEITPETPFTVAEFSSLFGFPAEAIIEAIRRNRTAVKKAFYSIPDLAARWNCSRATVYNILRESEFKVFDLAREGKDRGKKLVPSVVVEKIEAANMKAVA